MKLFEMFDKSAVQETATVHIVGDKVFPKWESQHGNDPMEVVAVNGTQVTVKDDWGNTHPMLADDLVPAGVEEGIGDAVDTVGRKMGVKLTPGAPKASQAPRWATHVGQTPAGAYHWLSNETPVETDDSNEYFPEANKTEFTGYMGQKNKAGIVEPINMLGEAEESGNQKLYMVRCIGNFWGGKWYETGIDSIVVAAGSPDEAVQIGQSNIDAVIEHFHNKKVGSRKKPALRRKDNKVEVTNNAKELKQTAFHKVLTSNGSFDRVDVAQGLEEASREAKQNWFETLNAALESEGLLNTWDGITQDPISYGENRSYNAYDDEGQCRHISIYRETDGRYERPVHYPSKMCGERVEEGRHDSPKGDRITTDINPLISEYHDGSMSGHMNLTTFMSIHAIGSKYQLGIAKAVMRAGEGTRVKMTPEMVAQYNHEYEKEGKTPPVIEIELSMHHESDKAKGDGGISEGGIGKAIKKGAKSLKRGVQGWGGGEFDSPQGPKDMAKRVAGYTDDNLKSMDKFHSGMGSYDNPNHSPAGTNAKLVRRNLRKRGHRDFEKYMNEAEHSEAVQEVLIRLKNAGGKVYDKAILQKGNETAMLAQNGNVRFAIFQDGKVKRAKKFIEFQRDGWEIEMNLDEAIIPYTEKEGNAKGRDDYYDEETGQIFRRDELEKGENGEMVEKPYQADTSSTDYGVGQYDDDEDESEGQSLVTTWDEVQAKKKRGGGNAARAAGMFGDIAAGGGDPIDHLMSQLGMSMEEIDALAKENGYDDANEWAESYAQTESVISNFKKLDKR